MRKKILDFTAIAVILILGACSSQDEVLTDSDYNNESVRSLKLTATMPEGEPQTRVDLNRSGKNIELKWEVNDEIELVFVHDEAGTETITKSSTTVSSVSPNGKVATFDIVLPTEVTAPNFNLYGIYGGQGIDTNNETYAILPENPGDATSLDTGANSLQNRKDVMLHFSSENIALADLQANVVFKHAGSIFSLTANNITQAIIDLITQENVVEVRLVGVNNSGSENWAYNSENSGQYFDLVNESFVNLESANNYISFKLDPQTINVVDGEATFYGWYPMPGIIWPELELQLVDNNGDVLLASTNTKAAKTTAPDAGKAYYFYASLVNNVLSFTNDAFEVPTP